MNYELAKELKEAGWKFKVTSFGPGEKIPLAYFLDGIDAGIGYIPPTLEELIEACGDSFVKLENLSDMNLFIANGYTGKGEGLSASEAVARLWLALNT